MQRSYARRSTTGCRGATLIVSDFEGAHRVTDMNDEERQTRRDLRAAIIFGIVAATLELGALLYFFR